MAKYKKYPKTPKASSSLDSWKRHEEKVKEVDKFNTQIDKDKAAKKTVISKVKKMKSR